MKSTDFPGRKSARKPSFFTAAAAWTEPASKPGKPGVLGRVVLVLALLVFAASSSPAHADPASEREKRLPELAMNTHLHAWELVDLHLDMIQALGVRKVRYTLYWRAAEEGGMAVDPETSLHTPVDNFADYTRRMKDRGMEMVAVVHGMPNLPDDILADLDNWERTNQRFADFLGQAAEALPEVRYWQIWNEPDAGHWGRVWDAHPFDRDLQGRRYAELLKLAYPAIKQANPAAVILTAGLTGNEKFDDDGLPDYTHIGWTFLRAIYDAGGAEFFDILGVHSYYPLGELEGLLAVLDELGDPDRELWLTEFGHAGDDQAHLQHWRDVLETPQPYRYVFGYTLFSDIPDMGLLESDAITPRPAYDWLESRAANNSFHAWASANQLPAEASGTGNDPAGDGIPNVVKYALGLNPFAMARGNIPRGVGKPAFDNGALLGLEFGRNPFAVGVGFALETSGDLRDWQEIPHDLEILDESDSSQRARVAPAVPGTSDEPHFLRLRWDLIE